MGGDELEADGVELRPGPGQAVLAERSFAPGIGGYFLVQVADRREALELARSCPHLDQGGWIEIFNSGSSAVTSPPGLRFHVVVPSGSRSMSIGSRLATTTKSELPEPTSWPFSGLTYASSFAGPMPSIDKKTRHSSASVAYAATTRRA